MNRVYVFMFFLSFNSLWSMTGRELIEYEKNNNPDVVVNVASHVEIPPCSPPSRIEELTKDKKDSDIKKRSKKYAVYGTVIVSVLTTVSTLAVHFTSVCECPR